jgi:hypothetical protein
MEEIHFKQSVQKYVKVSQEALKDFCPEFYYVKPYVKTSTNIKRSTCYGGMDKSGPGISIAYSCINRWWLQQRVHDNYVLFKEYSHMAKDPIIGSAFVTTKEQLIALITGHEMSHACQSYIELRDKIRDRAHGPLFQKIYNKVRLVINKGLPDQIEAQVGYNKFLKSIKQREWK